MKLALVGYGRMGRMIEACAAERGDAVLGAVDPEAAPRLAAISGIGEAEAALDFSYPGNLAAMLEDARALSLPLVIGTTGYTEAQGNAIREAAKRIPIVWADNYSTGVTVLLRLCRQAKAALGDDFDIELIETHHRRKVDAPSGTAKALLAAVNPEGRPLVYAREGIVGARGQEIGVHSLRGGTVAGEHRVLFFGEQEELELRHRADSRAIFARGALRAADFARTAAPGLYNMEDVLFGG